MRLHACNVSQASPQHYSQGFRSRADRLIVNKPLTTTPVDVGPGCYDLSKDGKSVGVRTEKRVCPFRVVANPFLTDWRTYMQLGSTQSASPRCHSAGGGEGVNRSGERGPGHRDRQPSADLDLSASQRQRKGRRDHGPVGAVQYSLNRYRPSSTEARRFRQGSTHQYRVVQGKGNRYHNPPQQHSTRAWDGAQDPSRHSSNKPSVPDLRRDQANSSLRGSTVVKNPATQPQGSVSGLAAGSGSTAPKFIPRPPSVRVRARPRTARSARSENTWDQYNERTADCDRQPSSDGGGVVVVPQSQEIREGAVGKTIGHNIATATTRARDEQRDDDGWKDLCPKPRHKTWSARRRPASASRAVRSSSYSNKGNVAVAAAVCTEVNSSNSSNIWLDAGGKWAAGCRAMRTSHARRATAEPGAASRAAAAIRASAVSQLQQRQRRRRTFCAGGSPPRSNNWAKAALAK